MKKFLLALVCVITLTGCSIFNKDTNNTDGKTVEADDISIDDYSFEEYNFDENFVYTESIDGYTSEKFNINNMSEFHFDTDAMSLFYKNSVYMSSVDLVDYLYNFKSMFSEETKIYYDKKHNAWKLNAEYEEDGEEYHYFLVFDFDKNIIYASELDSMIGMYFQSNEEGQHITDTINELYVDQEITEVEKTSEVVINLSDYDIKLEKVNDRYLIPFDIARFYISSYDTKLLFDGDEFAYYAVLESFSSPIQGESFEYDEELVNYFGNFYTLIMESTYGLQHYNTDYLNGIEEIYNVKRHAESFKDYVVGLEDLHTSVVSYLYGDTDIEYTAKETEYYIDYYKNYSNYGCSDAEDEVTSYEIDSTTAVVEVNSFMSDTFADEYFEKVNAVRGYDNIVLDIKCNGGGYLANSYIFLYPFLDEAIESNDGDIYGGRFTTKYGKSENKKIETVTDKNIYLVTSKYTFSAGNYAAVLFKDYNVGTIVGETSGGGTCMITAFQAPDGSLNVISAGSGLILDKDFKEVEKGAAVDVEMDLSTYSFEVNLQNVIATQ